MALVYAIRKAYIAIRRTNSLCDGCDGCPFKDADKASCDNRKRHYGAKQITQRRSQHQT